MRGGGRAVDVRARVSDAPERADGALTRDRFATDGVEAVEIELGEVTNALERLEASCEALEAATRADAGDKECADALRENARTISTLQARVYELTLELARRRGDVGKTGDVDVDEGAWV